MATSGVSVVIPCYNGEAYLEEAINSSLTQTLPPDQVIIVDDCSNDRSLEIAESFGSSVRVIRMDSNSGGPARPINVGVRATTSEFIAVLDQDDLFAPQKLEAEINALTRLPVAQFAFSLCGRMSDGRPQYKAFLPRRRVRDFVERTASDVKCVGGSELFVRLAHHGNILVGFPAFTFRRSLWEQFGGIDESMSCAADLNFLCRACSRGDAVSTQQIGYFKRAHSSNFSKRNIGSRVDCIRTFAAFVTHSDTNIRSAAQKAVRGWSRDFGRCLSAAGFWRNALAVYRVRPGRRAAPLLLAMLSMDMLYWSYCQITGQQWQLSVDDVAYASGLVCQQLQN